MRGESVLGVKFDASMHRLKASVASTVVDLGRAFVNVVRIRGISLLDLSQQQRRKHSQSAPEQKEKSKRVGKYGIKQSRVNSKKRTEEDRQTPAGE